MNWPTIPLLLFGTAVWVMILLTAYLWFKTLGRLLNREPILPPGPPRVVPWGGGSVLAVVVLYFVVNLSAVLAYGMATRGRGTFSPRVQLVLVTLINSAMLLVVPLLLRLLSGARASDFGIGSDPVGLAVRRGIAGCLLLAPIVYVFFAVVAKVWKPQTHPLEAMLRADPSGRIALLAFLAGVLATPAAEELLFRGVLQGWLVRSQALAVRKPPPWSLPIDPLSATLIPAAPSSDLSAAMPNLVTSFLFAALHASQWPAPIPLFVLSLGLGYLYERTGGVIAPFVMHASFNGLSTAMLSIALLSGHPHPPAG